MDDTLTQKQREAVEALEGASRVSLSDYAKSKGLELRPVYDAIAVAEVVRDLPGDNKRCAKDGNVLERIGEEICERLDYKPAQVRVIRHIRPKYACPCCRAGVQTAPTSVMLFPKSLATPSLLAHIGTAKFVDGLPLYRQEAQFVRLGVALGRATPADCPTCRGLTKSEGDQTIFVNRPGRSTYPDEKSVVPSGATPLPHPWFRCSLF